jgi:hypothetical protein
MAINWYVVVGALLMGGALIYDIALIEVRRTPKKR